MKSEGHYFVFTAGLGFRYSKGFRGTIQNTELPDKPYTDLLPIETLITVKTSYIPGKEAPESLAVKIVNFLDSASLMKKMM